MGKKTAEVWTLDDLPNVISSLKRIVNDDKKSKEVRQLATDMAVFLICIQVDLEHNNII